MKWYRFLGSHCTQQALEAKRLPRFGELGMQQTEFPLSSHEALVKWGLELIWFPPIKIICSTQKSHKVPIKARALAHWITLAQGWGAAGTRAAQGALPACGTGAVGCAGPPKATLAALLHTGRHSNTESTMRTSAKSKAACPSPPELPEHSRPGWGQVRWKCWHRHTNCHVLEKQLLQHAKERAFRWCKSAQLHWAVVIYTSWGMDQRHLLRLQCI